MVKEYQVTVKVTASLAANLAANSVTVANFIVDPLEGSKTSIVIPKGEYWVLEDAWIKSTQTPDFILRLIKNRVETPVETPPVNTLLVSNPSRPRVKTAVFEEHDTITGQVINLEAVGTGGASVEMYLQFRVFKEE